MALLSAYDDENGKDEQIGENLFSIRDFLSKP